MMKTSKILFTSLLAAAAMSTVPTWAATALNGTASEWAYEFDESYKTLTNLDSLRKLISGSPDYHVAGAVSGSDGSLAIGSNAVSTGKVSGVLITNASGGTYGFNTNITGSGVFAVVFASENGTTYNFTKDLSGFSGDFYVRTLETKRVNTLKFSGTSTDAISGTGTIESNCNVEYAAASGDIKVANSSISAKNLTFSGGANYTVSSVVAGNNSTASNNTLTLSAGTTTFTGTVSNFGNITVANGATLALSGANVSLTSAIANSGTVTVDDKVVFALAGLTGTTSGNITTYSLVSGGTLGEGWTSLTADNINLSGTSIIGRGATATFNDSGSVAVTAGTVGNLVWNSEKTTGDWNYSTDNTPWTLDENATSFMPSDNVTFNSSATVTVDSSGVTAGTMTVSAGTVALSGGKVTASSLNVATGAQLNIGNTVSATSLSGAGTVQLSSLSGLSTTFSDWTGALAFKDISGVSGVGLTLSNLGNSNSKIVFDGVSGTGTSAGQGLWFEYGTYNVNIEIASGGLKLTNGYSDSGKEVVLSGALSGSGTFEFDGDAKPTFIFTGDVADFTGTLKSTKATFEFAGAADQTFSGTLDGSANLVKSGTKTLTMSGDNSSLTGNVNINAGTLVAGSASALGTGAVSVAADAKLSLGTSAVSIGTLSGAGSIGLATGTTSSTLTVNQSADGTFSGSIYGELVSLVKEGTGTLDLSGYVYLYKADISSGTTTYADVTVNEGTLKISGHAAAGKLTVGSGAKLGLVGTAASFQSVEISKGGTIVVDMSAFKDETQTFALDLLTTSALKYNGADVTDASTLLADGVVTLSNWVDKDGWTQSLSYADSTLKLTMTIPEPSTFGLLAGVGALALVVARRRRRAK